MKTLSRNRLAAATFLAVCFPLWMLVAQPKGKSGATAESTPGIPSTMAYEGFLTDKNGGPLGDGTYAVTFLLYDVSEGGTPIWSEVHQSVRVAGGYFYVVLGKISPMEVPFDHWYYLAVKIENGPELTPRTELLSSAYSFRARYADEVADESITDAKIKSLSWKKITGIPQGLAGDDGPNGVPASVWSLKGNRLSDPSRDFLGTTDAKDLVFRTNSLERMRITADGLFGMGSDLVVRGSVTSRISENQGAFYLADPNFGLRRLQGNNDVEIFTTRGNLLLSGGNVGIGVASPMNALDVAGNSSMTGWLTVAGDGGIGNNLSVANALSVGGNTSLFNALSVAGNTALSKGLTVGGTTVLSNTLSVVGNTSLDNALSVGGSTGLAGPLSVVGNASMAGALSVQGNTTIDSSLVVSQNGSFGNRLGVGVSNPAAPLHVRGVGNFRGEHIAFFESVGNTSADGIAIQLSNSHTNRQNNFATFYNGQGIVTGRIEGFDLANGDWLEPPPLPNPNLTIDPGIRYQSNFITFPSISFNRGSLPSLSISFSLTDPGFNFSPGSLPSLSVALGSFSSPISFETPSITFTLPEQADFVNLVDWSMENNVDGFLTLDPLAVVGNALKISALKIVKDQGVTYGSKGADYAEWLEKLHPEEEFKFGQIVGVFGGKISKSIRGADQVLVVSIHPVVLGNQPPAGEEHRYEKVAFMGQVPAAVRGRVRVGDYIIASDLGDGTAIAVSPHALEMHQLKRIVGRAWEESNNPIFSLVNVAVGLQDFDWVQILEYRTDELQNRLSQHEKAREELLQLVNDLTSRIRVMEASLEQSREKNKNTIAEVSN